MPFSCPMAPAGTDPGLCPSRTCGPTGHRSARAGETRVAFPVSARTDDSPFTASMAGAIASATASRRDQDRPGAKAPGQRPPHPRRALASVSPGPADLQNTFPRGRGKRDAFPVPARGGSPLPRIGKPVPAVPAAGVRYQHPARPTGAEPSPCCDSRPSSPGADGKGKRPFAIRGRALAGRRKAVRTSGGNFRDEAGRVLLAGKKGRAESAPG